MNEMTGLSEIKTTEIGAKAPKAGVNCVVQESI